MTVIRRPSTARAGIGTELSGVTLFDGVPHDVRSRIIAMATPITRSTGECFFREGDSADVFLLLVAGRVKLTQVSAGGRQVILRVLSAAQAFGAAGAFGDTTYPVNAEAMEHTEALSWSSAVMRRIFETEARIALNALEFVAARLHDLQRRIRHLTTEPVDRRVARAVLRLMREAGRRVETGIEIDFPLTRQDVAEIAGTSLYTVSRLISTWERQGILRGGRRRLLVLNPNALIALTEEAPHS